MWFAARCAGRVREAESRSVLADFPFVIPGWEMLGNPGRPRKTLRFLLRQCRKGTKFNAGSICVKPSIDRALGKKLPDIHVTGLGRWWISRGGGGSQPLGTQNYASADGESTLQERLDLCCQFVLSSVRLFHATL